MYPQGVCRIRKPACAGNGCAIFPIFQTADWGQKIRYPAADDLFRVSLIVLGKSLPAHGLAGLHDALGIQHLGLAAEADDPA